MPIPQLAPLDRRAVRMSFEHRFTGRRMAQDYVRIYERLIRRGCSAPRVRADDGTMQLGRLLGKRGEVPLQCAAEAVMKVSEIMTPDVEVAGPDDTVETAARMMSDTGAGALPVCDGERLIGMVTDRDITIRAVAEGKSPSGCVVREVMTEDVNYAFEDEDVGDVACKMAEWQVRRLPVLDHDRKLIGIVSLGDIALEGKEPDSVARAEHWIAQPGGEQ
jgi:CBS domain-containing protein